MRVVALLAIRNEALYLDRCLRHLNKQGIETCLIDNESTDDSLAIAESWKDRGLFRIESLAYPGYFNWQSILSKKQHLAEEIDADWFIHYDADEIREAPKPHSTLQTAIAEVDRQGYNAINFDEFVFLPCHDDDSFEGSDYVQKMRYYYFFEPNPLHRINCWKRGIPLNLANTGGHRISSEALKVFPESFIMRHYIALSREHVIGKYTKHRTYSTHEVKNLGWHGKRAKFKETRLTLPDRHQLKRIDDSGWDKSDPWRKHPFLGDENILPAPFIVGVGRSGTTLLRLMLDNHPNLAIPPETHFLPKLFKQEEAPPQTQSSPKSIFRKSFWKTLSKCFKFKSIPGTSQTFIDAVKEHHTWPDMHLDEAKLKLEIDKLPVFKISEALRLMYRQYASKHSKERWGDKTPPYQLYMQMISSRLPESYFIHIIRDGRDVALSGRDLWFGPGKSLEAQAKNWVEKILETRRQAKSVPYYMEIRYEDLVQNPEQILQKVCGFISLDYDPVMLEYHKRSQERLHELGDRKKQDGSIYVKSEQRRAIHKMTQKKPDPSRISRWKKEMPNEERACFEGIAGALLKELGYEV